MFSAMRIFLQEKLMRHLLYRRLLAAATAVVAAVGLALMGTAPAWAVAPANDNFANAQAQTGSFTDTLSTLDATTEAGEPLSSTCAISLKRTVWYGLTVSAGTQVSADTIGSNYDTVLVVYTGASLGSLSQIACDDDGGGGVQSLVGFTASSSTTYWIQASGIGPQNGGVLDLNVVATTPGADVSVSVAESADPVSLGGDNLTYTLSVANNSTSGATGVTANTALSGASAGIVSATPSQGSCSISAPNVNCTLGSIAASGTATVTITVTPAATGTITATATVAATETDPNTTNNTDAESTTVNNTLGCTITGTNGNDTLNGTNGADVICGLGGNDTIDGGNSDDTIYAGPGNDAVGGGNGADTIYGQDGTDTNYGETLIGSLLYLFDNGNDTINGGAGNDDLDGQNGNDTLVDTTGTDTMAGGTGNDSINVQDGAGGDTANGGLGTDTCTVDAGDTTSSC
jgi:Ca2+-binding RTX toxin-like protein